MAKAEEALQEANTGESLSTSTTYGNDPSPNNELMKDKSQDLTAAVQVSISFQLSAQAWSSVYSIVKNMSFFSISHYFSCISSYEKNSPTDRLYSVIKVTAQHLV